MNDPKDSKEKDTNSNESNDYGSTPVFHGGVAIGTVDDLRNGNIDPSDRSWRM